MTLYFQFPRSPKLSRYFRALALRQTRRRQLETPRATKNLAELRAIRLPHVRPPRSRRSVILARLVGRHSTIRRIASRHYSAEGLLRMCRRPQRANLMRLQAAFASK